MSARTSLRSISTTARRLATPAASSSSTSSATAEATRVYGPRKAFLHAYYTHLLRTSQLVLLFKHDNLTVSNLLAIRRAIAKIPIPPPSRAISPPPPPPSSGEIEGEDTSARATLTISRTGVLSSLFKSPSSRPSSSSLTPPSLLPHLTGPTALITSPSLSPPYLSKLLTTINRELRKVQKEIPPNTAPEKVKQPTLQLVAGIMEGGRLVGVKEVESVGKLPALDTLRAQVVGLLEGQGRGLLGLLGQAGGGGLVRTLQGLEEGLKGGEAGEEKKAEP
ncbi:uncharacterized protein MKK02DRAFT_42322 [Dioszegia hungarica]|uniref:Uncharacterized protein n=1 Tax=Dioszegia hungarica TaxID=4972 RepID=A0AA38HB76_9TREE|nr:uncharacterized protein MKK02DRAFT_42322 [Dioszegia hungarica]KAI9637943.1 hypothetical protein MKK02DRAFT_42322 [Dioszegia hungarica]